MPFQPVENCVGAVVNGSIGSIPFVNTFGIPWTGAIGETEATGVGDFIRDLWADNLTAFMADEYAVSSITITDLRTETGFQFEYTDTATMTGDNAGQALPFQCAALITWTTALRGRSYRGRNYFGGFVEAVSSGRDLDSTLIGGLQDFVDAALAVEIFGVISRFHGVEEDGTPIPRDPAIVTDVSGGIVHPQWRTQRRRALASD
jgi:hypothetical protein